jgi:dCTP deaminase
MILSGKEIIKQNKLGNIYIENFDKEKANPNSYNISLHNKLLVYKDYELDMKKKNETEEIIISEEGFLLEP